MRISDWSSDVCSSDLFRHAHEQRLAPFRRACSCRHSAREPCRRFSTDAQHIPSGNALSQLLRRIRRTYPATPFSRRSAEARRPEPSGSAIPTERSEEHTSELQSLMRITYAVFCLKNKTNIQVATTIH